MRNVGGSIGISAVTTLVVRRQQVHQHYLARNTFESNPDLQQVLTQMTARFQARTGSAEAMRQAYGRIYGLVQRQTSVLAYIHTFGDGALKKSIWRRIAAPRVKQGTGIIRPKLE
jgi:MFS transporter, DHA2 family, multidrug resistance protein